MFFKGIGIVVEIVGENEMEVFALGQRYQVRVRASKEYIKRIKNEMLKEMYTTVAFNSETNVVFEDEIV